MSNTPNILTKTLPHNIEVERTVIGALLLDPEAITKVAGWLEPDDFFDPVHALIYQAIHGLYEQRTPIDFKIVADALKSEREIEQIGGPAFLAQLAMEVPTSSHIETYARILHDNGTKRRVAKLAADLGMLAGDSDQSAEDVLEAAEKGVVNLSRQSSKPLSVQQLCDMRDERFEHYATAYEADDLQDVYGIFTGFTKIDDMLSGLAPGHLMIIAGRPSMGKTALALNIAHNVAEQDKSVMFFSLEMTKEQLFDRTFAGILGVPVERLVKGDLKEQEYDRIGRAMDTLADTRLFVSDDTDCTLTNIKSKARRHQLEHGLDLLVIDYLQLIEVTGTAAREPRVQQITTISNGLKHLARELAVPVIALSQLSRAPEQRSPPIPIMSDLRESGAIEQDAESVLMIYRDDYYNDASDTPGQTDVYVRKNRITGRTGIVELLFNAEKVRYESAESR